MVGVRPAPHESKRMVEVWDCGGVPGAAGQRTCLEVAEVAGEIISTISYGSGRIDSCGVRISGGGLPMRPLALALP